MRSTGEQSHDARPSRGRLAKDEPKERLLRVSSREQRCCSGQRAQPTSRRRVARSPSKKTRTA